MKNPGIWPNPREPLAVSAEMKGRAPRGGVEGEKAGGWPTPLWGNISLGRSWASEPSRAGVPAMLGQAHTILLQVKCATGKARGCMLVF